MKASMYSHAKNPCVLIILHYQSIKHSTGAVLKGIKKMTCVISVKLKKKYSNEKNT